MSWMDSGYSSTFQSELNLQEKKSCVWWDLKGILYNE